MLMVVFFMGGFSTACSLPEPAPLPEDSFAFGVFGDAPYYPWERGPWRRVLRDVGGADLAFFVHVGDILWQPCSDGMYRRRRAELDGVPVPVIYTPGDNEWADCHEARPGGYDPLERLAALRRVFFDDPGSSLGGERIPLVSQAADPAHGEFVENARWWKGGIVFATVHMVGSMNAMDAFEGRTEDHDRASARRTDAAMAWISGTFAEARAGGAWGVALLTHADPGFGNPAGEYGHDRLLGALRAEAGAFPGEVLFIHGDSHEYLLDHPLTGGDGEALSRFTRLETVGSPRVGWVRVVADTVAGRFTAFEPRWMRGYW